MSRRTLAIEPVSAVQRVPRVAEHWMPPGIKVTGLSLETGLTIEIDGSRHTAADVARAISANNPADADKFAIGPDGAVFERPSNTFIIAGKESP